MHRQRDKRTTRLLMLIKVQVYMWVLPRLLRSTQSFNTLYMGSGYNSWSNISQQRGHQQQSLVKQRSAAQPQRPQATPECQKTATVTATATATATATDRVCSQGFADLALIIGNPHSRTAECRAGGS